MFGSYPWFGPSQQCGCCSQAQMLRVWGWHGTKAVCKSGTVKVTSYQSLLPRGPRSAKVWRLDWPLAEDQTMVGLVYCHISQYLCCERASWLYMSVKCVAVHRHQKWGCLCATCTHFKTSSIKMELFVLLIWCFDVCSLALKKCSILVGQLR